ncbi:pseudouridine synthase [Paraburkholderia fungorum]|uniref:pseudouridine synthase n=1 Tax=Paraburkholderia fungorum TaxID=134537 RepID=UPI000944BE33|nr:pseudouridine synthase [Paraburkholderia fungorum]
MRVKLTAKHPRPASSERAPVRTGTTSGRKPTRPAGPKPSAAGFSGARDEGAGATAGGGKRPAGKPAGAGPRAPRAEGSFSRERDSGAPRRAPSDRPPRREGAAGDRGPRRDDGERAPRSFGDRPPRRDDGDRGPRRDAGDRSERAPRRFEGGADRSERAPRSFGDRPPRRDEGDRGPRRDAGDRTERAPRSFGDRPPRRDEGDRGPRRDSGDRTDRAPRSFGDRPPRRDEGDRGPRRDFGDRTERAPRSFGDRPPRRDDDRGPRRDSGDRTERAPRSFGDRPPRRDDGDRGPRRDSGDRTERAPRRFEGSSERAPRRDDGERRPFSGPRTGDGRPSEGGPRGGDRPRFGNDRGASQDRRGSESAPRRFEGERGSSERGERPARSFDKSLPSATRRFGDDRPARADKPRGPSPAARTERSVADDNDAAPRTPRRDYEDAPGMLRLSKLMSELGLCSRREADEWIEKGWVMVDGEVVDTLGTKVRPDQRIEIDPAAEAAQASQVTVLIHKPVGLVSGQAEDGYQPAITLVTPENRWEGDHSEIRFSVAHLRQLAPAGRLDIDSTGLLVLTQDGRVAKQLIGGHSEIDKEYLVRVAYGEHTVDVESHFPAESLELLCHGLSLDDQPLKPAQVNWQNGEQLRFVLREGKKRQIRRMCELVGLEVIGLKRVRMGQVMLGALPPGQWRYLSADESF